MLFGGGKSGNGGEGGVGATGGGHSSPSAPGRGAVETVEERAELSLNESELSALRSGGTLQRASLEEPPRAAGKDSNGVGEGHLNQHRRKLSLVGDENSPQFEEMDPSERYGRFGEELGRGACKVVYKAFDTQEGREVAWNKVDLGTGRGGLGDDSVASEEQDRILAEIRVLKALKHKNIMSFYKWWYNEEKGQVRWRRLPSMTVVCVGGNFPSSDQPVPVSLSRSSRSSRSSWPYYEMKQNNIAKVSKKITQRPPSPNPPEPAIADSAG